VRESGLRTPHSTGPDREPRLAPSGSGRHRFSGGILERGFRQIKNRPPESARGSEEEREPQPEQVGRPVESAGSVEDGLAEDRVLPVEVDLGVTVGIPVQPRIDGVDVRGPEVGLGQSRGERVVAVEAQENVLVVFEVLERWGPNVFWSSGTRLRRRSGPAPDDVASAPALRDTQSPMGCIVLPNRNMLSDLCILFPMPGLRVPLLAERRVHPRSVCFKRFRLHISSRPLAARWMLK
jgi:hypothetical protein